MSELKVTLSRIVHDNGNFVSKDKALDLLIKLDQKDKRIAELEGLLKESCEEFIRLLGDDNGFGEVDDCFVEDFLEKPEIKKIMSKGEE